MTTGLFMCALAVCVLVEASKWVVPGISTIAGLESLVPIDIRLCNATVTYTDTKLVEHTSSFILQGNDCLHASDTYDEYDEFNLPIMVSYPQHRPSHATVGLTPWDAGLAGRVQQSAYASLPHLAIAALWLFGMGAIVRLYA
jgi:hypothetical protein